ncbi:MAG: hypothetical protein FGM39_04520, partial [Phycisphaerales bacterium]|nr:hypothetical protein [Phycisphaerales bacterium]
MNVPTTPSSGSPAPVAAVHSKVFGDTEHLQAPPPAVEVPAERMRAWLRDMFLIREFEVRCMQAYQEKKIGG